MGIATRGRRKLVVGDRHFVWYVVQDSDSADLVLHVASQDKAFVVKYHLGQPDNTRYLIVLGREFTGLTDAGGCWIRVLCPKWENNGYIGPGSVRSLIEWAHEPGKLLTRVDWLGRPTLDES